MDESFIDLELFYVPRPNLVCPGFNPNSRTLDSSMDVVPLSIYTIVTACDQSLAVIVGKT